MIMTVLGGGDCHTQRRSDGNSAPISKKYVRVREGQKHVVETTTQSTRGKSAPKQQQHGGEGAQVCVQNKG